MLKVSAGPGQDVPLLVLIGVIVMVAIIGFSVELEAIKLLISPVPDAANPIVGLELVQAYVVVPPILFVEKVTLLVLVPVHKN